MTATMKVLNAFRNGAALTAAQITSMFGVQNPRALVTDLRQMGYPIYLDTFVRSRGRTTSKYHLGTAAPRAVIAAGYKALASTSTLNTGNV